MHKNTLIISFWLEVYQIFIDPAISNYVSPLTKNLYIGFCTNLFLLPFLLIYIHVSFDAHSANVSMLLQFYLQRSSTIFNDVSTALLRMRYISLYELASYIYGSRNIFLKNDFVSCLSNVNLATTLLPLLPSSASSSSAATAVTYFFLYFLSCSSFYLWLAHLFLLVRLRFSFPLLLFLLLFFFFFFFFLSPCPDPHTCGGKMTRTNRCCNFVITTVWSWDASY